MASAPYRAVAGVSDIVPAPSPVGGAVPPPPPQAARAAAAARATATAVGCLVDFMLVPPYHPRTAGARSIQEGYPPPISVNLFFGQGLNGFESSIPLARMASERRETGETCG